MHRLYSSLFSTRCLKYWRQTVVGLFREEDKCGDRQYFIQTVTSCRPRRVPKAFLFWNICLICIASVKDFFIAEINFILSLSLILFFIMAKLFSYVSLICYTATVQFSTVFVSCQNAFLYFLVTSRYTGCFKFHYQ